MVEGDHLWHCDRRDWPTRRPAGKSYQARRRSERQRATRARLWRHSRHHRQPTLGRTLCVYLFQLVLDSPAHVPMMPAAISVAAGMSAPTPAPISAAGVFAVVNVLLNRRGLVDKMHL